MVNLKRIPDAISNFSMMIDEDYVYLDKTEFLERYENFESSVSMLLRPRRFGKTMFTEIMRYYYDVALKTTGDRLFHNTYIGSHPTPLKNSFYVLRFSFSGVEVFGTDDYIAGSFKSAVVNGIADFLGRYPEFISAVTSQFMSDYSEGDVIDIIRYYNSSDFPTPAGVISNFIQMISHVREFEHRIMVIIDEYDNFTNDLLTDDALRFSSIARKDGFIGRFYSVLRSYNESSGPVNRIFITGVLPVTMDTAVSGFVSAKLSFEPLFNETTGFTDENVETLLKQTVDFTKCRFSISELKNVMKERYDGYRFASRGNSSVYNSTLCLNFVKELRTDYEQIPQFALNSGSDIDYRKLKLYLELMNEQDRKSVIEDIILGKPIKAGIGGSVNYSLTAKIDRNQGLTILYHLGFLTLMTKEEVKTYYMEEYYRSGTYLKVPNTYFTAIFDRYLFVSRQLPWADIENADHLESIAYHNDVKSLYSLLETVSQAFVHTDNSLMAEYQLVMALYVALSMNTAGAFKLRKEYYIRHNGKITFADNRTTDASIENGNSGDSPDYKGVIGREQGTDMMRIISLKRGRADLVALNQKNGPSYIFEFKYEKDRNASENTKLKKRAELLEQAKKQLDFYVTDDELKQIRDLHRYVIMYTFGEFMISEV